MPDLFHADDRWMRCPDCGHDLADLIPERRGACPECGRLWSHRELPVEWARKTKRREATWRAVGLYLLIAICGVPFILVTTVIYHLLTDNAP